jgi:hypothetical protein
MSPEWESKYPRIGAHGMEATFTLLIDRACF